MVGFDVTPTTASSRIRRASPPLLSRSRERKSIQTLWPSSDSSCRRDLAMSCAFHFLDFFQPPTVPLASIEFCPEKDADEIGRELRAHHLGAEAQDVHVVVLDPLMRRVDVVADGRADAGKLVRRH